MSRKAVFCNAIFPKLVRLKFSLVVESQHAKSPPKVVYDCLLVPNAIFITTMYVSIKGDVLWATWYEHNIDDWIAGLNVKRTEYFETEGLPVQAHQISFLLITENLFGWTTRRWIESCKLSICARVHRVIDHFLRGIFGIVFSNPLEVSWIMNGSSNIILYCKCHHEFTTARIITLGSVVDLFLDVFRNRWIFVF